MNPIFVLVTAARNEEAYLEKTIKAVVSQTVKPKKWVIVSDNSTDRTEEIINQFSSEYDFIKLLVAKSNMNRSTSSKVNAIEEGLERLKDIDYQFIGNIDADIEFKSDYFERLLERFHEDENLGIAGGWIYELKDGRYKERFGNSRLSVPGSIQMFRRECFEAICGYIPLITGGEDTIAEVSAQMHGWIIKSFPDLKVFHQRATSIEKSNRLFSRYRQGKEDYFLGYHPLFEILKCLKRIKEEPLVIGSIFRILGYLRSLIGKKSISVPRDVVLYLRREQMMRVKSLLKM